MGWGPIVQKNLVQDKGWLDKDEAPVAFWWKPCEQKEERPEFVTDTMSIRNGHLEEVEDLVVQNEGVNPYLVGFDWYVVDVGLDMWREAPLVKALTRKPSSAWDCTVPLNSVWLEWYWCIFLSLNVGCPPMRTIGTKSNLILLEKMVWQYASKILPDIPLVKGKPL